MPAISRNGKFLTKTKTQADIGGVSSVRLYEKQTGSQGASSYKIFTISGSYVPGSNTLVVYVNGQKAERVASGATNSTQYVETSAKVVTFGASLQATDIVEFAIYGSYNVNNLEYNTNSYEYVMATTGTQVTLPFTPSSNVLMSVYIDGVRQATSAYSVSGTTVTFSETIPSGTQLLFVSPNTDDLPLTNADTVDGYHASQLVARKNVIINGAMDIWQRGTSFSGASGNIFAADRFFIGNGVDGTANLVRSTDVPTVSQFGGKLNYSFQVGIATADTSITSENIAHVAYKIEGYDTKSLMGKYITLSYWIKSSKTGIFCNAFRSGLDDRSYIVENTIYQANTWEYKKHTILMHDGSSGTWDYTNGAGLKISWALATGTSYHTTPNTWASGNFFSTSNNFNFFDNTANVLRITGVQLEIGDRATDFEFRSFQQELAMCQRYYEKSYSVNDPPGTVTYSHSRSCMSLSGTLNRLAIYGAPFAVTKRTIPTSVRTYAQDGTIDSISVYNNGSTKLVVTGVSNTGDTTFGIFINTSTNGTAGELYIFHFTADAEL